MAGFKASQAAAEPGETQGSWFSSSSSSSGSCGRGDSKKVMKSEVDGIQKSSSMREAERAERILNVVFWGPHLV
ncbi:unnamed protein product [Linum trigynum]|uniref:Uncharacterized protein n=1 Tax=Linum trigynum TaxID=586398 RepID=A0AAV2F8E0_9ROSI